MTRWDAVSMCSACMAGVLMAGCSLTHVSTSHDPAGRFRGFRTYAWVAPSPDGEEARSAEPELDGRIRASLDRSLQGQGFQRVEDGVADFLVDYHLGVSSGLEVMRIDESNAGPDGVLVYTHLPDDRHRTAIWGVGPPRSFERKYRYRFLTIKIIEPGTSKVLWRGSASMEIPDRQSWELQCRRMDEAVRKTLRDFPPR